MSIMEEIAKNLTNGSEDGVKEFVSKALEAGEAPGKILNEGLLATMSVIGERFKKNEVYVPQVLIAARAMKAGMSVLQPHLVSAGIKPKGTAVIGTVQGDMHDIGKNLVCMMLEGAGFKVVDLGISCDPQAFAEAAVEHNAQVIGVSALLTTTMTNMKAVIESVAASPAAGKAKIMVGGAPLTQAFADEIGADGYAPDAASAADLALSFLAA